MTNNYLGLWAKDMGFKAHLTLSFLGNLSVEDQRQFNYDLSFKFFYARINFTVRRTGIEMFGPHKTIPVVTVEPERELLKFRDHLLEEYPDVSEYAWNPHITIKLDHFNTITIPQLITVGGLHLG